MSLQEFKVVNEALLESVVELISCSEATAKNIKDGLLKFNSLLITSAPSPQLLETLAETDFPRSMVQQIQWHQDHPPVVGLALQILARCAGAAEKASSFYLRAGALEAALLVMDRHPKHGGLQNAALFLLRSLVKDSASARQAVSNGAVDRVLAALALCLKGREVQYSGLVALRYMLEAGYPNRWQDSLKTVRANIQEATLQAKVTHQSDEGIHKVADQVLALVMPRFKEVLCWHFQSGWCRLGPKCTYAHGLEELRSVGRGKASGKGYFRGAFAGGA
mmetsp:Transcript_77610/g.171430  ORF Transcript_77610/g.171430 Transcript_77610/m.171430 type:complete len:278 (+) Transcript_77610:144-977(+)